MSYAFYYMVSMFIDMHDQFYERMVFTKYKNKYGDVVDAVDDLVMYATQVNYTMASSIRMVAFPKLSTPCGVYMIENNAKYVIAKRGDTNIFWGYNPYYGWNKLAHDLLKYFSRFRVTDAHKK